MHSPATAQASDDFGTVGTTEPDLSVPLADDELLAELARALVRSPAKVRVEETREGSLSFFTIYCDDGDVGLLIGRQGSIVSAMKHIFTSIAAADNRRIDIRIAGLGNEWRQNPRYAGARSGPSVYRRV